MKYALLIYLAPEAGAGERLADEGMFDKWRAYNQALKEAGALVGVENLGAVDTATTVRVRSGERLLTDGPFIETKEQPLGFFLVEAADLDAAIDWAARMPLIHYGTVEIRPVQALPETLQG
jgi:hypothetical protein